MLCVNIIKYDNSMHNPHYRQVRVTLGLSRMGNCVEICLIIIIIIMMIIIITMMASSAAQRAVAPATNVTSGLLQAPAFEAAYPWSYTQKTLKNNILGGPTRSIFETFAKAQTSPQWSRRRRVWARAGGCCKPGTKCSSSSPSAAQRAVAPV